MKLMHFLMSFGEAVHELELPGPLGPGFAKDPTKAASYAALAAAGAFASGVLTGR